MKGVGYVQLSRDSTNEMSQFLERGAPRALRVTEGPGRERNSAGLSPPSFQAIISCDIVRMRDGRRRPSDDGDRMDTL